jgi:lysozyme
MTRRPDRVNHMLLGIDVSNHQGLIDWAVVARAGVRFSLCKATEGFTFTDARFAANVAGARAHGIIPGAYHFTRPGDGAAQCDRFLSVVGRLAGILVALDVEARDTTDEAIAWLRRFARRVPGRQVLLYSNRGLWAMSGGGSVAGLPVVGWHAGAGNGYYTTASGSLAHQAGATNLRPQAFAGMDTVPMVQFTDHADIPGISGHVDGDVWLGSLDQLRGLAGAVTTPQPQEEPMPLYVRPEPNGQPGDGYLAVTPGGVHALTAAEWKVLQTDPAHQVRTLARAEWTALRALADQDRRPIDMAALAAAIVERLPPSTGGGPTAAQIAAATVDLLAARIAS